MKFSLNILLWISYAVAHIAAVTLRYPMSPIAVLFFSTDDKRHLTSFNWLETLDNDLSGDRGWRTEHITGDPLSNWNRIKWLWRNGANSFNYKVLGCHYQEPLLSGLPKECDYRGLYVRNDGKWLYRRIFFDCFEVYWGWAIYSPVKLVCKFTLTTRGVKKRNV